MPLETCTACNLLPPVIPVKVSTMKLTQKVSSVPVQRQLEFLGKALRIQRTHGDAFASGDLEPLIPTAAPGLFANRFSCAKETVWTLFNADYRTVRGPLLEVSHMGGAKYRDVWNGVELKPQIKGNRALLDLSLGPREIGCVVQSRVQ